MEIWGGACGSGKTKSALDALLSCPSGMYVAPTRSLAEQFAAMAESRGKKVIQAFGRKVGANCKNPLIDIAMATGHRVSDVCMDCNHKENCEYFTTRRKIQEGEYTYAVTTFHYLAMLPPPYTVPDIIIYDDITAPLLVIPPRMRAHTFPVISVALGGKKKTEYVLPQLPQARRTIVVSATPVVSLWEIAVCGASSKQNTDQVPLDQTVYVHLVHLTHSAPWYPPPGACGFKKNTPPGMPYFHASIGLNDWRGIPIAAAGSFFPPLDMLHVLAKIMSVATGEEHNVCFIPIRMVGSVGKKRTEIRSAVWGVKNHHVVLDLSCAPSVYPLVQLLGRSGVGVTTTYWGDIPLNFVIDDDEENIVQHARECNSRFLPPDVVQYHHRRYIAARMLGAYITNRWTQRPRNTWPSSGGV